MKNRNAVPVFRGALIFDADDTLWENNIYFERAFDDFVAFLSHSTLTSTQIRDVLNEIELVNAKVHGYGSKNFGRNLQQAYRVADYVAFMYLGELVEYGSAQNIFGSPREQRTKEYVSGAFG